MKKRLCAIYLLATSFMLLLTACQADSEPSGQPGGGTVTTDTSVKIHFRIGTTASQAGTRAWEDSENATDEEMMNLWTVIVVNATNDIVAVYTCNPAASATDSQREVDEVATLTLDESEVGKTYRVYSFANISASRLQTILGLDSGTIPEPGAAGVVVSKLASAGQTVSSKKIYASANDAGSAAGAVVPTDDVVTVNGNLFDGFESNGFGSKGIPMSNVQTLVIPEAKADGTAVDRDLILIRMLAKMELQVYNATATALKINKVVLSNVTKNSADNLYLLPGVSAGTENSMEVSTYHAKIQPRLASPVQADLEITPATKAVEASTWSGSAPAAGKSPTTISFYVNESAKPDNIDEAFYLTIMFEDGEGNVNDIRYALISQTGKTAADNDKWDYIARNDYRVIPVVLDDYKLELVPYDFPAIGVYPSSVKAIDEAKHLYEIDFHDYGHFHLVPKVTHNNGTEVIGFTTATSDYTSTKWGLVGNDWSKSWFAYTAYPGTSANVYDNATGKFYENVTTAYPGVDVSENGGLPTMDVTTVWNGFSPYIFGKIAPHAVGTGNEVYHEFKASLYVAGASAPRQLTYRFYMVLKDDHPAARRPSARSCR